MKRIIAFIILTVSVVFSTNAQQKIGEYTMSGKTWDVSVAESRGSLSAYINILGEYTSQDVELILDNEKTIKAFSNGMKQILAKYKEWVQVAKDNDVTDLTKEFDIKLPTVQLGWKGASKWYFDFSETLRPLFMVNTTSGKTSYAIGFGGTATASSNQYIDQKYYAFFNSESEVTGLLELIEWDNLTKGVQAKEDKSALFK